MSELPGNLHSVGLALSGGLDMLIPLTCNSATRPSYPNDMRFLGTADVFDFLSNFRCQFLAICPLMDTPGAALGGETGCTVILEHVCVGLLCRADRTCRVCPSYRVVETGLNRNSIDGKA